MQNERSSILQRSTRKPTDRRMIAGSRSNGGQSMSPFRNRRTHPNKREGAAPSSGARLVALAGGKTNRAIEGAGAAICMKHRTALMDGEQCPRCSLEFMIRKFLFSLVMLCQAGCINISTELQPVNPDVQAALFGSDCVPIVLGFGVGTNTFEAALRNGRLPEEHLEQRYQPKTIRTIHSILFSERSFLGFGDRCLDITGEP